MGSFDTDDIDDELLGSIFDDWESVLSGGFGNVLDASSGLGGPLGSSAQGVSAAQTPPVVERSLSELMAANLAPRPASPGGPAVRERADLTEHVDCMLLIPEPAPPTDAMADPRASIDEEVHRFIDGPVVHEGNNVSGGDVTRFDAGAVRRSDGLLRSEHSAMLRENGVTILDDGVTRFDDSGAMLSLVSDVWSSPVGDLPDFSACTGVPRPSSHTPVRSAMHVLAGSSQVEDALDDDVFGVSDPSAGSSAAASVRFDSSIPDETAVVESSPGAANQSLAGAIEAQSSSTPAESTGILITLDHCVGSAEAERRVERAVAKAGRCTLALGPRSLLIDRSAAGQWRAVETEHDRAFAAGTVRSLIRRITSPRQGRDSVLHDLERRLARS